MLLSFSELVKVRARIHCRTGEAPNMGGGGGRGKLGGVRPGP